MIVKKVFNFDPVYLWCVHKLHCFICINKPFLFLQKNRFECTLRQASNSFYLHKREGTNVSMKKCKAIVEWLDSHAFLLIANYIKLI